MERAGTGAGPKCSLSSPHQPAGGSVQQFKWREPVTILPLPLLPLLRSSGGYLSLTHSSHIPWETLSTLSQIQKWTIQFIVIFHRPQINMNHFADTQLALFVFNCVNYVKIILPTIYVKIMSLIYSVIRLHPSICFSCHLTFLQFSTTSMFVLQCNM